MEDNITRASKDLLPTVERDKARIAPQKLEGIAKLGMRESMLAWRSPHQAC